MKSFNTITLLILLTIFTYSCSSDDDGITPDQEVIDIIYQDIVPKDYLDIIIAACDGVVLQEGNNPPADLQGKTFTTENIMFCTNIPNNPVGYNFADKTFTITDFNPQTLECKYTSFYPGHEDSQIESIEAYLLGDGNKFTIYAKELEERDGKTADFLNLLTGEFSAQGLTKVQYYIQCVRKDEGGDFIEPGSFRGFMEDLDNNENALVEFE